MDARIVKYKKYELIIRAAKSPLSQAELDGLSKSLQVCLPSDYIDFLKLGDKIWLDKNCIQYQVTGTQKTDCTFVFFLGISSTSEINEEFLSINKKPPEFFPNGLVAFAQDGSGNYICFDYRDKSKNLNPYIVIWEHEADIGKDVSFVAKDFETFIGMLKSDDEL